MTTANEQTKDMGANVAAKDLERARQALLRYHDCEREVDRKDAAIADAASPQEACSQSLAFAIARAELLKAWVDLERVAAECGLLDPQRKKEPLHGKLSCSFCGKGQREVRKLIAGPTVYICDECIRLCHDILAEEAEQNAE